jgi:hypothetical protein
MLLKLIQNLAAKHALVKNPNGNCKYSCGQKAGYKVKTLGHDNDYTSKQILPSSSGSDSVGIVS